MRPYWGSVPMILFRSGSKVPVASRDKGMPRRMADFSFPDGAQLVALSSGFLVGMLWVRHSGDPGVVHDLFSLNFPIEWTSRTVNSSVLVLSANETELIEILRVILYASKGMKDMNKAWLVEACLNPTPQGMFFPFANYAKFFLIVPYRAEMFNLTKMKSSGGKGSRSVVPSTTNAFTIIGVVGSTVEKRPSAGEGAGLRKRIRKVASKQPMDASGSTTRSPTEKGKGVVEIEEASERGYTIGDLCEVEDRVRVDKYFASIMT
ncbi:hypothetical protein BHE74_00035322 [Ensete ventricosum]|nr:hypothetical protein BHE74_00035322 [Ensete ventricosum]RZS06506.1 hypothetical protein BHM03_00037163 [Ensete ventricosum]